MLNPERWNNPAEVTSGVLGVTSGQKRPHMAHIPSSYDTHSNAHANFPSLPERDPCTPEQIKYDFQLLQERTILGGNSDLRSEQVFMAIETTFRQSMPQIDPDSA